MSFVEFEMLTLGTVIGAVVGLLVSALMQARIISAKLSRTIREIVRIISGNRKMDIKNQMKIGKFITCGYNQRPKYRSQDDNDAIV